VEERVVTPDRDEEQDSERGLLEALRRGDAEAAAQLYDRHHRGLYAYARSLLRDAALAEDVVHDAFVRLLSAAPDRSIHSIQAYLYTIARNLALDTLRRRSRHVEPQGHLESKVSTPGGDRRERRVVEALEQLPEEQRETVVLKIFSGLTFAQIGEVMSVPAGTAASRYRYALEGLADLLSEEEP
jgi:RNA polymerase sigma-70 factor (ECF subfamily)